MIEYFNKLDFKEIYGETFQIFVNITIPRFIEREFWEGVCFDNGR